MTAQSYAFPIGQFRCAVVSDGTVTISENRLLARYPDVPADDLRAAWTGLGLSLDDITGSYNCLLVRTEADTILFDAGSGIDTKPVTGHLLESLEQIGVTPDDVTMMVITHAHGDHIAGATTNGNPTFPNARYVISQPEWNYWNERIAAAPEDMAELRGRFDLLEQQGLSKIALGDDIAPGISTLSAAGHTPGQMAIYVSSDDDKLLHLVDTLHVPVQFTHPEWCVKFDVDPTQSAPKRRELLGIAADEGLFTLLYHLPFPGLGRVHRTDDAFHWQPLELDDA